MASRRRRARRSPPGAGGRSPPRAGPPRLGPRLGLGLGLVLMLGAPGRAAGGAEAGAGAGGEGAAASSGEDLLEALSLPLLDEDAGKYLVALGAGALTPAEAEALFPRGRGGADAVVMRRADGTEYLCRMPTAPLTLLRDEGEAGAGAGAGGRGQPPEGSIERYLDPVRKACMTKIEGWWTYEYCHEKWVRQFHQTEAGIESEFYMGMFDRPGTTGLVTPEGQIRGAVQLFNNGTPCDLTERPREARVLLVCDRDQPANAIVSIREPATCSYVVTISLKTLCNHPLYKEKDEKIMGIQCRKIAAE